MKKKILIGIVAVCVIILAVVVIGNNSNKSGELKKIGLIAVLSGEFASVGEELYNGFVLAQEIYNKQNPDKQIEVIAEDDGFDSKKALSAYKKLMEIDQVDALFNISTPSIEAIYDLVQADGKPILQMGEQSIEPIDDVVYGIFPGSLQAEIDLGNHLREQGFKNPLVVYVMQDVMIRFKDALIQGYGGKVTEMGIRADEKDFRTHVLKAAQGGHDVVVMSTYPQVGAQFIIEYNKQNLKIPQLAFDALLQTGFTEYKRILGDSNVLNGAIVAILKNYTSEEFKKLYQEKYGKAPGFLADIGYDAFNIIVETYDTDNKKWNENMKKLSYQGANGLYKFDSVGIRLPDVFITKIENGEIVQ
jgi:ABC-type branched-subunit amino acid transport system substrate-binding protein